MYFYFRFGMSLFIPRYPTVYIFLFLFVYGGVCRIPHTRRQSSQDVQKRASHTKPVSFMIFSTCDWIILVCILCPQVSMGFSQAR